MSQQSSSEELIRNLVQHQNTLYAYILTLLPDTDRARDLLQETSVELWSKADQFVKGTNFLAWACRIAYFKVLAYRRDCGRERLMFSSGLLDTLAVAGEEQAQAGDHRSAALDDCLAALPTKQRELVLDRYGPGGSIKGIAADRGRSPQGLAVTLHRIRQALLDCIEHKLQREGG
jgi:RNA polymerase sigma-70 factor, ECF subfamily